MTFLSVFAQKEAKRYKLKTGTFLFLLQGDHILLLRRYRTGIEDGLYVVPMGGHDGQGPLSETLIREAHEETNIRLEHRNLQVCHVMHRWHPMPEGLSFEQVDVFFKADIFEGNIENREPDKCDELQFYPLQELPAKTAPFIRHAIDCFLKGQFYSEFGWDKRC